MTRRAPPHHGHLETLEWKANQPDLTPEAHCWQKQKESLKIDLKTSQEHERRKDRRMALRINQNWTNLVAENPGLQRKATEVGTRAKMIVLKQKARSIVINQQQRSQTQNSLVVSRMLKMMLNPQSRRPLKKTETDLKKRREINLMKRRINHMILQGTPSNPRSRGARIEIRIKIRKRKKIKLQIFLRRHLQNHLQQNHPKERKMKNLQRGRIQTRAQPRTLLEKILLPRSQQSRVNQKVPTEQLQ